MPSSTCTFCSESFKTYQELVEHREEVKHFDKLYLCEVCNARFSKQNGVENHFRDNHLPVSGKGKDDEKMNRMWDEGTFFTKSEKPEPKKEPNSDGIKRQADDNNSQKPPVKKVKKFDPTKPSTSKAGKIICCEEGVEYKYSATNIKCSGKKECRIRPGGSYMFADDTVYCMRCFGVEKRKKKDNILGDINNWRQLENVVETFEALKECGDCRGLWHESCSMTLATTTFICYKCITGYSIPKIEIKHECPLSQFMSERMNKLCGKPVTRNTGIAVVNFTSRRTVDLVADRPDHLKEQFRNKYGNTTNYTQRMIYVIQRTSKADVIFFSMICHEYENHAGTKYCLIDTLDSVPYFTPTATVSRGAAHHEVMVSYFDFMRRVGYEKAHLWANAPVQGDNMIFTCHPMAQKYLSQVELEGYYENMLAKGEIAGIFKKWKNFGGFKEDVESNLRKKKDYKGIQPIHIPIFEGSQWEYFNQKYEPEPEDKENSEAANFMRKFTRNIPDNLTNTFWMDLKKPDEPMNPELLEGKRNSHEDLGDKMSFLELCVENNWEFSTLRRAQYATMGIIDVINRLTVVQD